MKKKPSTIKDILFLSISSFVLVAAWIGFNLYHSYVTTTITPELQVQIEPIQPEFDTATIEKLKARRQVLPLTQLSSKAPPAPTQMPATKTEQATPTVTPISEIPVVEGE